MITMAKNGRKTERLYFQEGYPLNLSRFMAYRWNELGVIATKPNRTPREIVA
jgi:hypothetical protein